MYLLVNQDKIIEIFCNCDDFSKVFDTFLQRKFVSNKKTTNKPGLAISEIMSIAICYHLSGIKCFQYYYTMVVSKKMKHLFPKAPSYNRFIELLSRCSMHLFVFIHKMNTRKYGLYYVDSKQIRVCHNLRIFYNRVFKGIAQRGKGSTGWFYGLKLFMVINPIGEIVKFSITRGNVADNNLERLLVLFRGISGKVFGDKGFIVKAKEKLQENGIQLITKVRNNMKNKLLSLQDKFYLKKRGVIESVFDLLTTICDIEHSRHRSPANAITHLIAGLVAYNYFEKKPSVFKKSRFLTQ